MSPSQTNVEFVTDLMEFSAHGALIQAFVHQYSKRVSAATPEELDNGLVSGHAWHGCAIEVQERLAQRLAAAMPAVRPSQDF